jgi:AbrB family looped-hinge helix DNA binding protein
MQHTFVHVSSKGQIVIPAELREAMGIETGTRVAIERQGDAILLRPVTDDLIRNLRGITKGAGKIREREHRKDRW